MEANDCKKGLTVSDARSPQEGSENGDRKSCADTKYSDGDAWLQDLEKRFKRCPARA